MLPGVATRLSGTGGAAADWTVIEMFVAEVRGNESVIVTGNDFAPVGVATLTVAVYEKTLSPAVTSPFVASSKNV